jgi:FMN reductase
MSSALKVVALVGSPTSSATSRTLLLVRHLLASLQQRVHASVELVELAPIARSLGQSLSRDEAGPAVEQALQTIEGAELLVVAAPVYRGSYPGCSSTWSTSSGWRRWWIRRCCWQRPVAASAMRW